MSPCVVAFIFIHLGERTFDRGVKSGFGPEIITSVNP